MYIVLVVFALVIGLGFYVHKLDDYECECEFDGEECDCGEKDDQVPY